MGGAMGGQMGSGMSQGNDSATGAVDAALSACVRPMDDAMLARASEGMRMSDARDNNTTANATGAAGPNASMSIAERGAAAGIDYTKAVHAACMMPLPPTAVGMDAAQYEQQALHHLRVHDEAAIALLRHIEQQRDVDPELSAWAANASDQRRAELQNLTALLGAGMGANATGGPGAAAQEDAWNRTLLGMAATAHLDDAANLSIEDAQRAFLDAFIVHDLLDAHLMDFTAEFAASAEARAFAQNVSEQRHEEIRQLREWREAWHGEDAAAFASNASEAARQPVGDNATAGANGGDSAAGAASVGASGAATGATNGLLVGLAGAGVLAASSYVRGSVGRRRV